VSFTDKTKSAIPFVKYASSIAIVTSAPSILHTVRFPVWAKKLQARPQNVRNDGGEQRSQGRKQPHQQDGGRQRGIREHRREPVSSAVS